MKRIKGMILLIACAVIFCLGGCAEKEPDIETTTVFVQKNGKVTDAIVESFEQGYYSALELQSMLDEEVAAYNAEVGQEDAAVVSRFDVSSGVAKVFVDFKTGQDYADFNQAQFFLGSINEAYEAGIDLDVVMKSTEGEETLSKEDLLEKGKYKILIIDNPVNVVLYKKILYTSANVEIISDKEARISDEAAGPAYLVFR
ncbi:MAG TPA: hypothetical protein VJZ01_07495 [Lachnospiraceae bacterium]|nr:hypothetical protein [Lachnospiraceae bacterium]